MTAQTPKLIAPKRVLIKWVTTLLVLCIPFLQPGGVSLLRLDIASRTLLFFGARVRLEEFFLLLLATLFLVFGFILVTLLFGRVWCGWFCPQTTLIDLTEFLEKKLSSSLSGKVAFHVLILLVSFLVAANLLWYFYTPQEFFRRLLASDLGTPAYVTLAIVAAVTWMNILFVRRIFCTAACPYGRIQLLLTDNNTLTLEFDPAEGHRCIRCGACVRACPTGIDIRQGLQVECINCGRCLDACRIVMAKKKEEGIIHYTFGRSQQGGGRPFNIKTIALLLLVGIIAVILVVMGGQRKDVSLTLQRNALAPQRVLDGALLLPYSAYLENRTASTRIVSLSVKGGSPYALRLIGPTAGISLSAEESRRVDFILSIAPQPTDKIEATLELIENGKVTVIQHLRTSGS